MLKYVYYVGSYKNLNRQSCTVSVTMDIVSKSLIPKYEYVTFQTYFLSLLVKEKDV